MPRGCIRTTSVMAPYEESMEWEIYPDKKDHCSDSLEHAIVLRNVHKDKCHEVTAVCKV